MPTAPFEVKLPPNVSTIVSAVRRSGVKNVAALRSPRERDVLDGCRPR